MKHTSTTTIKASSVTWWDAIRSQWDGVLFSIILLATLIQVFYWLWPSPPRLLSPESVSVESPTHVLANTLTVTQSLRPIVIAKPMSSDEDLLLQTVHLPPATIHLETQTETPLSEESSESLPKTRASIRPLSLNRSTAQQLETLPRVGPKLAQRIVDYRHSHGPFRDLAELDEVKGIGPKLLEKITPYLVMP